MANKEINTSVGTASDLAPEARPFSRMYWTLASPINDYSSLLAKYARLSESAAGTRRQVLRAVMPQAVLDEALNDYIIPVEAVIPMDLINGDQSSIVYIGKNNHDSPRQGVDVNDLISHRNNHKTPLQKAMALSDQFVLSNNMSERDFDRMMVLWKKFGWNRVQLENFNELINSGHPGLWISFVREKSSGDIVGASTGELLALRDMGINFIETTEYSTMVGYEGKGICTASVAGLVAQITNDLRNQQGNSVNVIAAEFNTSSTSAAVGASAGFIIPEVDKRVPGILRYNVAVDDGADPNPIFHGQKIFDRDLPYENLRDFAVGVIPTPTIEEFYNHDNCMEIINLYNIEQ